MNNRKTSDEFDLLNIFQIPRLNSIEQTRKSLILFRIIWGLIVITAIVEILYCITLPQNIERWISTLVIVLFVCFVLLILTKKGYLRLASYLLIGFNLILLMHNIITGGGMESMAVRIIPIIMVAASLIIGWKEGIFVGLIISVACLLVAYGQIKGLLPHTTVEYTPFTLWLNLSFTISLLCLIQYLSIGSLDKALNGLQNELDLRKKAEKDLRKSEAFRLRVFDTSILPIVIMNPKTLEFIECNIAAVKMFRFNSKADAIGKSPLSVSPDFQYDGKSSVEKVESYVEKALADGSVVFEWKHIRPDGELWDSEVHLISFESEGQILLQFTVLDITERKKSELELSRYHDRLEFLVQERTEELATTNEEYKTINEELYSQKEELQSAIHSLNVAQEQLIQSEKMASLGVLSAGIAHEINNPLNYIHGGMLGIQEYFNENLKDQIDKVNPFFNAINIGIERASAIVASLRHYSRHDNDSFIECNIHIIIDNCLVMLHNKLKNKAVVTQSFTSKQFILMGNDGKLHQAILNIILNAEQAIEQEGTIHIQTAIIHNQLVLTISDNGCGIDQENLHKIFDPFFTTKAPGKGTGLGLSITQKIILEHNGNIECESEPGKGSTFIIKLPVTC